jgi:photosystem II stability/assembly factor-like uncharacterized protein
MSDNGGTQTAVMNNSNIWRSINGGATWSRLSSTPIGDWRDVAVSDDGDLQIAVMYGGDIWRSINGGGTWSSSGYSPRNWTSIAMSEYGDYLFATEYNGKVWISTDYGDTWSEISDFTEPSTLNKVAVSQDGQYVTAVSGLPDYIYRSEDYGSSWTMIYPPPNPYPPSSGWNSISMSEDGSRQTIVPWKGLTCISTNYGVDWTAVLDLDSQGGLDVAMSYDGEYQTVVRDTLPGVYISATPSICVLNVQGDLIATGSITVGSGLFTGSNIVPTASNQYDIGSAALPFRH